MSAVVIDPGWYTARRRFGPGDATPIVVRLSQDLEGAVALVWQAGRRDPEPASDWIICDKVKINGDVRSLEIDQIQREAHADGVRQGREQAAAEQRDRERECPVFTADLSGTDIDFREVGESLIAVRMTAAAAIDLDASLSDFLCWARGYNAALGAGDLDRQPMGVEAVRRIRETLKKAQRAADLKAASR